MNNTHTHTRIAIER